MDFQRGPCGDHKFSLCAFKFYIKELRALWINLHNAVEARSLSVFKTEIGFGWPGDQDYGKKRETGAEKLISQD